MGSSARKSPIQTKREQVSRECQRQEKYDEADQRQYDEPGSIRVDAEPAATRREWRKRAQKLRGHEDGRHHGRERQRGQQRILDRVVRPGHEVPPVVEVAVGELEQPPERDREDEQRCEPAPIASEERSTRAAHGETVDGEDVSQPEREKRVLRVWRRPEPGHPPGDGCQCQPGPESQWRVCGRGGGPTSREHDEAYPPIDTPGAPELGGAAGMIARPATRRPVRVRVKGASVEWKSRHDRAVDLVG